MQRIHQEVCELGRLSKTKKFLNLEPSLNSVGQTVYKEANKMTD